MEIEYVIIECFSGRYFIGFNSNSKAVFNVIGGNYRPFKTYEDAENILLGLEVDENTRLKIEKHYVNK